MENKLNQECLENIARKLSDVLLTQVCCTKEGEVDFFYHPAGLTNPFLSDPILLKNILNQPQSENIYFEEHNSPIFYGILRFAREQTFIIGPISVSGQLTSRILYQYLKAHHILDVKNYYIHVYSCNQILSALSLLNLVLTGQTLEMKESFPKYTEDCTFQNKLKSYQIKKLDECPHFPYYFEQEAAQLIKEGNYEELKKLYAEAATFSNGKIATSLWKEKEYGAVIDISLMIRHAIEAGINPYEAYDMNDLYLQKISQCTNQSSYDEIWDDAIFRICRLVKKSKAQSSVSILTEKCKSYVSRNLNKNFTVKDIAEHIGITPSYLSAIFSEYEHMTVKQFITKEKMNAAKNMLKYSDYNISEIVSYLNFCSQSYFSEGFKKETGLTPSEYRKRNNHNL